MTLPYLSIDKTRKRGKVYHAAYYRRDGIKRRLAGADGKPVDPADATAVAAAWALAHEAHEAANAQAKAAGAARQVRPRSIADLIAHYRASPEWEEKADETRRDYEKALKPLENDCGHLPAAGILRQHVLAIRNRYAWRQAPDPAKPGATVRVPNARQANRVVTVLSILLSYACDIGWRADNPALRPKRLKARGLDYRAWTEAEFVQFMERADAYWRFAALLALLIAQRGQDLVDLGWADYDGSAVYLKQKKRGARLRIEVHATLKPELDAWKKANEQRSPASLTVLARPDGTKWKVNAFQKAAGAAIRAAGLKGVVWHGLRSTAASWAADGGATTQMIQNLLGHTTARMTEHYARGANQRRMADGAVRAIVVPIKKT